MRYFYIAIREYRRRCIVCGHQNSELFPFYRAEQAIYKFYLRSLCAQ